MTIITNMERLVDKIAGTVGALRKERDRLLLQVDELKSRLSEKELEIIRVGKENQRLLEISEREKMVSRKEKEQFEEQLKTLHGKLSALVTDQGERAKSSPSQEEREI